MTMAANQWGVGIEDLAICDIEPLQEYLDFLDEDYWEASDHPFYIWAAFILEEIRSTVWNLWSAVCRMIDERRAEAV